MKLHNPTCEIFIPDQMPVELALARTTHLCIAAHQDDVEIMAAQPILECFQRSDKWFSAVVITDGRGSPRSGVYSHYSGEEMRQVRFREQRKAAVVGEYSALILLDYPSSALKDGKNEAPLADILEVLIATTPEKVFTHNLADKHDTHVAAALRTIAAARRLPAAQRPRNMYGCEVWRGLDWMLDDEKILMDLSQQENLQAALLGVFDSQISGGKRYDLATLGRRRANASYYVADAVDITTAQAYAMDLTPLLLDDRLDPTEYALGHIDRFARDVADRLKRVG